jgi:WD40 repeat protein
VGDLFTARLWDLEARKIVLQLDTPTNFILQVAFAPDGRHIATTSEGDRFIRLWDLKTPAEPRAAAGAAGLAAPAPGLGPLPAAVGVYAGRFATARQVRMFEGHTKPVQSIAFSSDGARLLSGGDQTVRLWDVKTGKLLDTFAGHEAGISSVAFSPTGNLAASAAMDETIRLWDLDRRSEVAVFKGHRTGIVSLAFAPGGRHIASGSMGAGQGNKEPAGSSPLDARTLRVWSLATQTEAYHIESARDTVGSVAFSPDGRYLASGGADGKVRLWRMR